MRVYAAVIAWPDTMGRGPELFLARTKSECNAQVRHEIVATAIALYEPAWREAIEAHQCDPDDLSDWLEAFDDLDDRPYVTTYITEV
ncbi:hypothetical protein [Streptomyces sp. AC495_CC817]|uniref:hypothetical protein n=1 Tax=Streptomyces sp. AC495_CC817 TaxID=2823900 RepID=UPI001C26F5EC|nr:hypothetical protein [Streptomyces sp. AC495_CC817]